MNTQKLFAIAFLGLVAGTAVAGEYKCYVSASDSKNYIVLNEAENIDKSEDIARSQKVTIGLIKPLAVTSVIECKPATEAFTDVKAMQLDSSTPR